MPDYANNTSRPRVRYEQSPNGEVVRVMCGGIAHSVAIAGVSPPARAVLRPDVRRARPQLN
jgi:hypothetical protein